jgi:hypothetical protein
MRNITGIDMKLSGTPTTRVKTSGEVLVRVWRNWLSVKCRLWVIKSIRFDFSSSVLAFREFSDAACIDVETHHRHAGSGECCGNRQADIS